jgi:apolipoprotein N-acyltransferase
MKAAMESATQRRNVAQLRKSRRTHPAKAVERSSPQVGSVGLNLSGHLPCIGLGLGSFLLKSLIFAPISFWPFALVCLAPWLIMIGTSRRAPWVYLYSFLGAFLFFLLNMRWMIPATGWGYLALCVYQAVYFPLMACPLRHGIRRRRVPLAVLFPVVWVGNEIVRAVFLSGFPWFFLSHSLYRLLPAIQISDLVGAYGVSFVLAAVNGAAADGVFLWLARRKDPSQAGKFRRKLRVDAFVTSFLIGVCLIYGLIQLGRDTVSPGPRVAVLQGDFISRVTGDDVDDAAKRRLYLEQLDAAAAEQPDLFLLPETPWIMYLNPEVRDYRQAWRESFLALRDRAIRSSAYIVTGSASLVETPTDLLTKDRRFNSAMVFKPDGSEPERYDKVHVVPFGETVPFRTGRLRFLYFWINRLMPFSGRDGSFEYSIFPGDTFKVFAMTAPSAGGRELRFGVPICYEDVMPYVSREFVSGGHSQKRADFLLNISNDGWFGRGIQQPQHLAVCVFRAVENRVGIARAVNTGISGFIAPTGRLHDLVTGDAAKRWPGNAGFKVAQLGVDSRYTLYSRYGDWFAWLCAMGWLVAFGDYWLARLREQVGV